MTDTITPEAADEDLRFIKTVVEKTHLRIDPHAFHYVHWGLIIAVWFPLGNYFSEIGKLFWLVPLGVGSVLFGTTLSCGREVLRFRESRLPGENTFIARQVNLVLAACIVAGMVLSFVAPAFGFVRGQDVPIIWGLIYANVAFMTGVVYTRDFLYAGAFIFAGVVLAIAFSDWNGYILGPVIGAGMVVPGIRAERRVKRMVEELGV